MKNLVLISIATFFFMGFSTDAFGQVRASGGNELLVKEIDKKAQIEVPLENLKISKPTTDLVNTPVAGVAKKLKLRCFLPAKLTAFLEPEINYGS